MDDTIQKHENNYLKMPTLARDEKGNYYLNDAWNYFSFFFLFCDTTVSQGTARLADYHTIITIMWLISLWTTATGRQVAIIDCCNYRLYVEVVKRFIGLLYFISIRIIKAFRFGLIIGFSVALFSLWLPYYIDSTMTTVTCSPKESRNLS